MSIYQAYYDRTPALLAPALKRGLVSVKKEQPYLIDVITQPR